MRTTNSFGPKKLNRTNETHLNKNCEEDYDKSSGEVHLLQLKGITQSCRQGKAHSSPQTAVPLKDRTERRLWTKSSACENDVPKGILCTLSTGKDYTCSFVWLAKMTIKKDNTIMNCSFIPIFSTLFTVFVEMRVRTPTPSEKNNWNSLWMWCCTHVCGSGTHRQCSKVLEMENRHTYGPENQTKEKTPQDKTSVPHMVGVHHLQPKKQKDHGVRCRPEKKSSLKQWQTTVGILGLSITWYHGDKRERKRRQTYANIFTKNLTVVSDFLEIFWCAYCAWTKPHPIMLQKNGTEINTKWFLLWRANRALL